MLAQWVQSKQEGKEKRGNHLVHEEERSHFNQVLLMVISTVDGKGDRTWYLDTGCSNHMMRHMVFGYWLAGWAGHQC